MKFIDYFGNYSATIISTNVVAPLIYLALFYLACKRPVNNDWELSLLLLLCAIVLGWVSGMLLSPYKGEESQFAGIVKGISAFASGYLLSKFDQPFSKAIAEGVLFTSPIFKHGLLFTTAMLLTALVVFVNRLYFAPEPIPVTACSAAGDRHGK